jgi:hypothetical protein
MPTEGEKKGPEAEPSEPAGYEPPDIVWEELFEAAALKMSCTHHQMNPGCSPGPYGH